MRAVYTTCFRTASKASSEAVSVSFWERKFTFTYCTPSTLRRASSSFSAQFAQSISSSLNVFFMRGSSFYIAAGGPRFVLLLL